MTLPQSPTLFAGLCLVTSLAAFLLADAPVSRRRVEKFANRHQVPVTADNGSQIISYLARTRRWRIAGLVCGATAYTLLSLEQNRVGISISYLLAGWFAGALIAEVRVVSLATRRRAASLVRRTAGRYLPRIGVWALPSSVLVSLLLTLTILIATNGTADMSVERLPVWLGVVLIVALVVWATTRRVLHRSQPIAAPDIVAADDAIRSRSLHVLVASGTTLVLYCVLDQLIVLTMLNDLPALAIFVMLLGAVAIPWSGWRLATSRWVVPPVSAAIS